MTMIARVFDGLPLAASVQEDEQTGKYVEHSLNDLIILKILGKLSKKMEFSILNPLYLAEFINKLILNNEDMGFEVT